MLEVEKSHREFMIYMSMLASDAGTLLRLIGRRFRFNRGIGPGGVHGHFVGRPALHVYTDDGDPSTPFLYPPRGASETISLPVEPQFANFVASRRAAVLLDRDPPPSPMMS